MNRKDQLAALNRAREEILKLLAVCDSPQLDAILRSADMELHWALWNLGEAVPLRPEMAYPEGIGAAH